MVENQFDGHAQGAKKPDSIDVGDGYWAEKTENAYGQKTWQVYFKSNSSYEFSGNRDSIESTLTQVKNDGFTGQDAYYRFKEILQTAPNSGYVPAID